MPKMHGHALEVGKHGKRTVSTLDGGIFHVMEHFSRLYI